MNENKSMNELLELSEVKPVQLDGKTYYNLQDACDDLDFNYSPVGKFLVLAEKRYMELLIAKNISLTIKVDVNA